MGKIIKFFLVLVVLIVVAVVGYAVFFELPAPVQQITIPIEIGGE